MKDAYQQIIIKSGFRGLFLGWEANLLKDVPFSGIKMSLFEGLGRLYRHLVYNDQLQRFTPKETAFVGLSSGILTAFITAPIDNVNTRIKSGKFLSY